MRSFPNKIQNVVETGAAFRCFLLAGQADGERIWRGDQQTHGRNQHVQTSGSCHEPLAALRVILQDALVPF